MLRGGCDRFVDHLLVVGGDGVEQFSAELGEQADRADGLLYAAPPAAGPVEHRPHE
jgi:hypothetical protein